MRGLLNVSAYALLLLLSTSLFLAIHFFSNHLSDLARSEIKEKRAILLCSYFKSLEDNASYFLSAKEFSFYPKNETILAIKAGSLEYPCPLGKVIKGSCSSYCKIQITKNKIFLR